MKRYIIFTILVCILLGGCRQRPKGVLSDSEMEDLLVDLSLAEAYEQSNGYKTLPDSVRNRIGEGILLKHSVDSVTLDRTYDWYAKNIDDYYKLYNRVDRRLHKVGAKVSGVEMGDNSANDLWNLPNHFFFSPLSSASAYVFDLNADKLTKGESLEWNLRMSKPVEVELHLGIDYMDSTISLTNRTFRNERSLHLKILSDSGRVVRRIFGSIYVDRKDYPLWVDSISLIKTPFDSTTYNSYRYQKFSLGARKIDKTPKTELTLNLDNVGQSASEPKISNDSASIAARKAKHETLHRAEKSRRLR